MEIFLSALMVIVGTYGFYVVIIKLYGLFIFWPELRNDLHDRWEVIITNYNQPPISEYYPRIGKSPLWLPLRSMNTIYFAFKYSSTELSTLYDNHRDCSVRWPYYVLPLFVIKDLYRGI